MARSNAFGYIGIGKQSVVGTPVAPVFFFKWRTLKASPKIKDEQIRDGQNRNPTSSQKLAQWAEIDFGTWLSPNTCAALIDFAIGGTDVKTGAGDPYTHTYAETNALLSPLTVAVSMGNGLDITRYQDCYIEELKIQSKGESIVTVDVKIKGGLAVPGQSADTVTFDTDRFFEHPDATFTFSGLTANSGDVTDYVLTIKNTLDQIPVPSITPVFFPAKRDISYQGEQFVPNTNAWRDTFFGSDSGTTTPIVQTVMTSLVAVWDLAGSPDHQISLTLNNVAMKDADPNYDKDGKAFQIKPMGTVLTSGGTPAVQVVAKNANSTAY